MTRFANDPFIFFVVVVLFIILISIQFTLNRILKVLNEIKAQQKKIT